MSAFENVDFPAPAGPVTKTAYLIFEQNEDPRGEATQFMLDPLCVSSFQAKRMVADES